MTAATGTPPLAPLADTASTDHGVAKREAVASPVGDTNGIASADHDTLDFARGVLHSEAQALASLAKTLGESFTRAVGLVDHCRGSVVLTGMGKAGHVANKISASLASTGTPSYFLHPAEALHGDLGRLRPADIVIALSFAGETQETTRLVALVKRMGLPLIAMTGRPDSTLGQQADVTLSLAGIAEACPLGLAPSTSTTAMMALGDALFLSVARRRKFAAEDFAVFHPAGSLGRRLMRVEEVMGFRAGDNLPLARPETPVAEMLAAVSRIRRRPGAVLLTDATGQLCGIFSDGDLRRLLEAGRRDALDRPVSEVMTVSPKTIGLGQLAVEALEILRRHRIDELPVVDHNNRPVGLLDIQDLTSLKL